MSYASLYSFLARAFHSPADESFLNLAAELEELRDFQTDELADDFTWLFEFNVYPYASVFLDGTGMLNSDWAGFVSGVYEALGLELTMSAGLAASDHISAQLEAVAVLAEREESAQDELSISRAQHGQAILLTEHILPWLPSFTHAIKRISKGFYAEIASMTLELCLEHSSELIQEKAKTFQYAESDTELNPSAYMDTKKKAGQARTELQALITPAKSGLFLSREDITRLGRTLQLPTRFAERAFMLENLVTSAADADLLANLFQSWRDVATQERNAIQSMQVAQPKLELIWSEQVLKLIETERSFEDLSEIKVTLGQEDGAGES